MEVPAWKTKEWARSDDRNQREEWDLGDGKQICISCFSIPARDGIVATRGGVWDGIRPVHGLTVNTRQAGSRTKDHYKGVSQVHRLRRHSIGAQMPNRFT